MAKTHRKATGFARDASQVFPQGDPQEDDEEGAEPTAEELAADEQVEKIKSELGDKEGYVLLLRRKENGQLAHLARFSTAVFSIEYVMQRYGGGSYVAKFYRGGESVTTAWRGQVAFDVDSTVQPAPVGSPVAGDGSHGINTMIAMALDKLSDAVKALNDRPAPAPVAAPDPMAMIEKLATTMRMLTPAPVPAPPAMDLEKQLGIIEKVVNVGTSIVDARGGGGEMSSGDMYAAAMLKVADPIIEVIKDKVESDREQRALRRGHQPALPPGPSPSAAPAKPEDNNMLPPWVLEVRRLVPMILTRAARGKSAENTAYFVLDDLSDMTRAKLAELAATESFDADVMKLLPQQLQQRPEWCQEFIEACKDYLLGVEEEVEEEAEGPEPEPGTDGDAESPPPSPIPE